MANSKQAEKRARQALVRRARNFSLRSTFRTALKKARGVIAGGDAAAAVTQISLTASTLDTIARKGIVHPNKAARLKSKLAKQAKALQKT